MFFFSFRFFLKIYAKIIAKIIERYKNDRLIIKDFFLISLNIEEKIQRGKQIKHKLQNREEPSQ